MKGFVLFTLILLCTVTCTNSCGVVYLQPALGTNDDYNRDTTYSYAQDEELYVCTSRSDLYIEPEYEFDVVSKLNYPRIGHSSTLMDDDKIIIIGGYDNQGNFIKEIETYDHKDKTTTLVGELSTARYKHSATKLIDGRILITGGYSEHGVLSSAEIYDPYTKTSKIINRMNYKRAEHQSLRNRDGSIFIFGGYDDKQEPLSIVELFDPLSLNFKLSEKNISTYFETIVIKNRFEHTETIKSDGTMVVIGGMDEKDVLTPEIEELRLSTSKDEFMEILVISGTPPYKFNLLKGNGLVDKKGSYTPLGVFSSQQVLLEVRDSANKSNIVSFYVNILEQ